MKKFQRLLNMAFLILFNAATGVFAQTTATATWPLTADQNATVSGAITASPQSLSVLSINGYSGLAGPSGSTSQRVRVTSGWPQNTAYVANRYSDYTLSVTTGIFNSVTVTVPIAAAATGNMRADIFYSTDNFATSTQLNTGGTIVLSQSAFQTLVYTFDLPLPITVGGSFSLRTFPWYTASDLSTSRYFLQQNISVQLSTVILPLKLLSFNSAFSNNKTTLLWSTANETNMQRYEVEKASNVNSFSSFAKVAANNQSSNNYSFTDNNAISGKTFYRLKMIDKDGSFTYSQILSVNGKASNQLSIYPNPVINTVVLNHPKATANAVIKLTGVSGKVIRTIELEEAATQSSFNVGRIAKGSYILQYYNGNDMVGTVRFIKQ